MKIMSGKAFMKEFIIAKEYRGMNNYKPGACVPALAMTRYCSFRHACFILRSMSALMGESFARETFFKFH